MSRQKSNFQDPLGLVWRMLASKNRAAYSALFREALRMAAAPIDIALRPFESRRLKNAVNSDHPILLIVGAPRSGTTLVYQVLAHYLDVTYPPNTSAVLARSPVTAALLQHRWARHAKPDFKNFYGQTSRLADCNDAFAIWNRWLGEDRYYPRQTLTDEESTEMRRFFNAWTLAFDKPFLNKNNRNAFGVELLAKHLPQAKFIVVRRNPLSVAQSLIVARQKVQGNKQTGWGLESASTTNNDDPLAHVDAVCEQIAAIDTEMNRQLATVASDRVIDITYESFCERPQAAITSIASAFDGIQTAPTANLSQLQPFEISSKTRVSAAEERRIRTWFDSGSTSDRVPVQPTFFTER